MEILNEKRNAHSQHTHEVGAREPVAAQPHRCQEELWTVRCFWTVGCASLAAHCTCRTSKLVNDCPHRVHRLPIFEPHKKSSSHTLFLASARQACVCMCNAYRLFYQSILEKCRPGLSYAPREVQNDSFWPISSAPMRALDLILEPL